MPEIPIQIDLFGGPNHIPGLHVVAAHMRVQPDGTEVFVTEHVRMNRGRTSPRATPERAVAPVAEPGQMSLFGTGGGDQASSRTRRP